MKVLITGATGLVGTALCRALAKRGDKLVVVSRRIENADQAKTVQKDLNAETLSANDLEGVDAIVNLAGEPIADGRWTDEKKKKILDSRVNTSANLTKSLLSSKHSVKTFISASAIGVYGDKGDELVTEDSPVDPGFLGDVCKKWESAHLPLDSHLRRVVYRIGVVLSPNGGALKELLPIFRVGLGGRLGDGKQWMSWIHIDDLVALFLYALDTENVRGVYNAVSPNPETNAQFTKRLAHVLHRPSFATAPAFAMKLALGEKAQIVLDSQRVGSKKIRDEGFQFVHPELGKAFESLDL